MLDVNKLVFDYPDKPLLQGVQFTLEPGCLLHVRGKNGAGKTTLLKLLAGLLRPVSGDIQYNKCSIYNDLATYQQNLCYVGHKNGISHLLTVRENYRFELHRHPQSLPFEALMKLLSLQGLENVVAGVLSAGQQRRLGLLRLLLSNAKLWLLDEPFAALDKDASKLLKDTLLHHLNRGGLIILTSHQTLALPHERYQEYDL